MGAVLWRPVNFRKICVCGADPADANMVELVMYDGSCDNWMGVFQQYLHGGRMGLSAKYVWIFPSCAVGQHWAIPAQKQYYFDDNRSAGVWPRRLPCVQTLDPEKAMAGGCGEHSVMFGVRCLFGI